ncbi:hypothetical protein [Streptomyces sp. NPDC051214]|uniref:hypothetical protein n=1 Tax=Streptomyces sp. NPDC051214 TaxID=3155282 RepID=UPI0034264EE5
MDGTLGIGGLLTACGGDENDAKSSGGAKRWSFKDDPGTTAKAAGRPRKIVTYIGAWAKLPAVKADQVISWSNEAQFSHAGYAPLIEQLAAAVDKSKKAAA